MEEEWLCLAKPGNLVGNLYNNLPSRDYRATPESTGDGGTNSGWNVEEEWLCLAKPGKLVGDLYCNLTQERL